MMSRRLTLITALNILLINGLLFGLHLGFAYGFVEYGSVTFLSETVYQFLARCYFANCFWLLVFVIGHLINRRFVSEIICFSSLIFVILSYRWVYLEKSHLFESPETITTVLRITYPLDLVSFVLVIFLLMVQIVCLNRNLTLGTQKIL